MEQDIFRAGVRPGGPTTNDEVKILICYMLAQAGEAMGFEQIHEALLEHELVNYFELVAAVDSLRSTGHIQTALTEDGADLYAATRLGRDIAQTVDGLLPPSVREKAVASAVKLLQRQKRASEVIAEIGQSGTGFEVKLSIPESGLDLINFSVFCPAREEAELVRRRFLNDPAYIYKGVMALLTGDREVIGEMFPSKDELF